MAMGCHAIVAEPLTITGSIGVVAATFSLQKAYERIGFSKEVISKGRCWAAHSGHALDTGRPDLHHASGAWLA